MVAGLNGFFSNKGWAPQKNYRCSAKSACGFAVPVYATLFMLRGPISLLGTPSFIQRFVKEFTLNEPIAALPALTLKRDQIARSLNSIFLRDDNNRVCVSACVNSRQFK